MKTLDMVSCTERMFKNSPENYFFLKQGGGRLLEDGRLPGQLRYKLKNLEKLAKHSAII